MRSSRCEKKQPENSAAGSVTSNITGKTPGQSEGPQAAGATEIVIEVSCGVVQAVYANGRIGVDLLDFDNEKASGKRALANAQRFLRKTRQTKRCVYWQFR